MRDKPLKILFLPKWYPNRFDILDGIFIVDHAKAAAKNNDVFLLFIHSDAELTTRKKAIYNDTNGFYELTIYFRTPKTKIHFIDKALVGVHYIFIQFNAYRKIKNEWGTPDITHVHVLLRTSFLAIWLKWSKGIPYLLSEHWTGYDSKIKPKINFFKKVIIAFVMKRASIVTAISEYLINNLKSICNNTDKMRFEIISNTVDENLFCIVPKPKEAGAKKNLIHISALNNEQKNFNQILKTTATVAKQRVDFELHIIGKGDELQKQIQLAQHLGILNSIVFFHGYLPKNNIAKMIAKSDLMILFSNYETQSCVLLESFLCGAPVIATNIGGVNEIVNNKNGILVKRNNTEELRDAILLFLSENTNFNAQEIRNNALIYSYSSISKKLNQLYCSIANK